MNLHKIQEQISRFEGIDCYKGYYSIATKLKNNCKNEIRKLLDIQERIIRFL